ncbi:MAG: PEPxxWA-CTERM sorting domain-containing protein [Chakrabartia sp.]
MSGDTFSQPFSITNTSTALENVTGFGISLISPFGFDVTNGGWGIDNSVPFSAVGGTGVTTGLSSVSPVVDAQQTLNFTFSSFGVGETFSWLIDVDQQNVGTTFGNQLIGSTGYADFSNGLRGLGTFVAIAGNSQGSQFQIRTFTPTPGVPEPATWAMMLLGFGATGAALRSSSRRRKTAIA